MSLNSIAWEFTATTPDQLAKVRQSLPRRQQPTVAGELFQMACLLESLANTDVIAYPLKARHTGENSVPDFQLESGPRRIAAEMAKVTTTNLEHARSLQMRMPDAPFHFAAQDLCHPEPFARKLKAARDGCYRFVAGRLPAECQAWLAAWNGHDNVPDSVIELFVAGLNSIIDGPPVEGDPKLFGDRPRAEVPRVEDFPLEETPRDRKGWLEDAFWEEWVTPINPTLMVSPFLRQNDPRMPRDEVLETGFLVPALGVGGPSLQEEHQIWIQKVSSEVQDKSAKLTAGGFCHGDEDWLVLWDRLGTADWQLSSRAEAVSKSLAPLWKPGWFSRVFIQDEHFDWQLMFIANKHAMLPRLAT